MKPHEKRLNEQDVIALAIDHLLDIANGKCLISEETITNSEDEAVGELLSGLLHLHETIEFQKSELTRFLEQENRLAIADARAEAERRQSAKLQALNQQLRASEQQLRAANQQLKAKEQALQVGRKELLAKMSDLERFNKLMVGRELEMIGLKKEVNELLERAGERAKYEVS